MKIKNLSLVVLIMALTMQIAIAQEKSKNHVAWEERKQTKSIRFYAEVGNNILLLWDSLQEK